MDANSSDFYGGIKEYDHEPLLSMPFIIGYIIIALSLFIFYQYDNRRRNMELTDTSLYAVTRLEEFDGE